MAWTCGNTRKFTIIQLAALNSIVSESILLMFTFARRYYLKYQNRRVEYISAFWNVANFDNCVKLYDAARKH